jgi:phage baseplate assembly protein W
MAQYTLYSNQIINWNAKGHERILQNVVNLLGTFRYEVAYDRTIGRDPALLDSSMDKMVPLLIAETYELIDEYEPRAEVVDVEILDDEADPVVKVVVEIAEGN